MGFKKHLLFVIDNLGSGGAQRQMTVLANSLANHGYSIDLFTYHEQDFFKNQLRHDNIKHIVYKKKGKIGWNVVIALSRAIRQTNYACILSFMDTPNLYAVVANLISFNRRPIIVSERFVTDFSQKGIKLKLKSFANRNASWLTANSNHEHKRWTSRYEALQNNSSCIYNCVDLKQFSYVERMRNTQQILAVASISPFKNGLCLVEALGLLKSEGKLQQMSVLWVGQKVFSIPERKNYILRMEERIRELGLEDHWVWSEPTDKIAELYKNSDVFVHPSVGEGLPNVVCEALATGLPIIVSNVLDHPILCDHGNNGYLFDPNSSRELADSLIAYFSLSKQEKAQLYSNARKFAKENFAESVFTNRYIEIINKITS